MKKKDGCKINDKRGQPSSLDSHGNRVNKKKQKKTKDEARQNNQQNNGTRYPNADFRKHGTTKNREGRYHPLFD